MLNSQNERNDPNYFSPVTFTPKLVNRQKTLVQLLEIFEHNDALRETQQQRGFWIPIAPHMFGSGKTTLGTHFTNLLNKYERQFYEKHHIENVYDM